MDMINIIGKDRTIILITHDMDMADNMDRIITLDKGKIISDVNNKQKSKKIITIMDGIKNILNFT